MSEPARERERDRRPDIKKSLLDREVDKDRDIGRKRQVVGEKGRGRGGGGGGGGERERERERERGGVGKDERG